MTTGNAGAVFFLGTRAHYQVLTPPESQSYDSENGNTSTETISSESIYQNPSPLGELWETEARLDNDGWGDAERPPRGGAGTGAVKRRLKKNRKQDGSSEKILNDNEDYTDNNVVTASPNCAEDHDTPKAKGKRGRISIAHLVALLARRKRSAAREQCLRDLERALTACTYRDSCRCLDCQFIAATEIHHLNSVIISTITVHEMKPGDSQTERKVLVVTSRYFECEESEDEYAYESSSSEDSEWTKKYCGPKIKAEPEQETVDDSDCDGDEFNDDDDEVFIDSPPAVQKPVAKPKYKPPPCEIDDDEEVINELELAAGAPAILNHLLTHPLTCAIQ